MREWARAGLRVTGELLVTAGLVVLLFAAYQLVGTGQVTSAAQSSLRHTVTSTWSGSPPGGAATPSPAPTPSAASPAAAVSVAPAGPVREGSAYAVLHVPRFGPGWSRVVVEGVGVADLRRGPGHYPGTAAPGEIGNAVFSGHRTTYGAPFGHLDELRPGDVLVVETSLGWATYHVTGSRIVAPTAVEVTWPVPGVRDGVPDRGLITLTTCHPKYSARQRLVVVGELAGTRSRADGPPPELA